MMQRQNFLMEAMGEPKGMSRSAMALCCAIIEDAEAAREFEREPRGAIDLLRAAMPVPGLSYRDAAMLPRELTNLIA